MAGTVSLSLSLHIFSSPFPPISSPFPLGCPITLPVPLPLPRSSPPPFHFAFSLSYPFHLPTHPSPAHPIQLTPPPRAISLSFAQAGAHVVIADLRPTSIDAGETEATHEVIQRNGGKAVFVKTDVSSAESVDAVVEEAVRWGGRGRIDVYVLIPSFSSSLPSGRSCVQLTIHTTEWSTTPAYPSKVPHPNQSSKPPTAFGTA